MIGIKKGADISKNKAKVDFFLIKISIESYDQIRIAILSNFDIFRWSFNLDTFFLNIGPVVLISMVSIILMIVMIYHAFILSKKKETGLFWSLICFMLLYYFLYAYWWIISIYSVIRKKELFWHHKSEVN